MSATKQITIKGSVAMRQPFSTVRNARRQSRLTGMRRRSGRSAKVNRQRALCQPPTTSYDAREDQVAHNQTRQSTQLEFGEQPPTRRDAAVRRTIAPMMPIMSTRFTERRRHRKYVKIIRRRQNVVHREEPPIR